MERSIHNDLRGELRKLTENLDEHATSCFFVYREKEHPEFKEEVRTRKPECVDKKYKKPMFGPQDTIGEPDFIVVDDNYAIRIQNPMAVL
ncbi:5826_t:CDS:2 [Funneliformis mosseae]|uniref:5826_t:CDS:1 n=1 Tax=Funneliformis mosseae TaxID=27381 RepID=A0A9N8WI98_FUNMO|nr:5826_t:CDS:2 [Funneliformis mosseae]